MSYKPKLVRDKIPRIIRESGYTPVWHTVAGDNYGRAIWKKLIEETDEFVRSPSQGELADILEVIGAIDSFNSWIAPRHPRPEKEEYDAVVKLYFALAEAYEVSADGIDEVRRKKLEEKGAFNQGYILEDVR